ncbi:Arylsulfatase A [Lutibacter oricola]|uniref:Arylsulfatase A n=1 Tax=Lutibacter oricola TaxID=762486 RepID=A0A1H2SD33_9FLAO|nr:arylsulfatase [Lutibacter oricola]SDW29566.1 Arylsulfatase A [Lutibacter oricola]
MNNFKALISSILFVLLVFSIQAQEQPNVVVIMADDIGLGDINFYHKQRTGNNGVVPTPNLDELAQAGMRFSDAHSPASLCAPTRFSMLTGNYSYRNQRPYGVWSPNADALIDSNNFMTIARIAKKGGYNTAFFGKWGLGGSWKPKTKVNWEKENAGALTYGFDYAVELPEGIQNKPYAFYENQVWMKLKEDSVLKELDADQTGYSTSKKHKTRGGIGDSNWDPKQAGPILVGKAVDYIKNQAKTKKPFYMYYCSQAVHIPHEPPAEFNGKKIKGATPGKHGDMIYELDIQVGLIVKTLKNAGLYDNTLLVFTSDNGGLSFDKDMKAAGHETSNGLNGSKGSINEGGHRVPFFAVWPDKIKQNTVSNVSIVGQDMVATIAALSNQKLDKTKVFDSANLLPVFKGETSKPVHKYLMHQSKGGPFYAIREGKWKLIIKGEKPGVLENLKPIALFNLDENLAEDEKGNLINKPAYAERITQMFETYVNVRVSRKTTVF